MNISDPITNAPVAVPEPTPMTMLQLAIEQGADVDKLAKLMDLEERWRAAQARKAFVAAMAVFKAEPTRIIKRRIAKVTSDKGAYSYRYANLIEVVDAVVALLSKHGFSHRWETSQEGGQITVACVLTHQGGHAERVALSAPPDDSGRKNSIQQIGSTVSYLQRYTLLAATGLAASDMDDDGRGAQAQPEEDDPAAKPWAEKLAACGGMSALKETWAAVPKEMRFKLQNAFADAKARIAEADRAATE